MLSAELSDLLERCARPLIWAGGGAIDAGAEVAALAARLGAPILTTFGARGIAARSELLVRLPPHMPEAGALWDGADLVIAVGSDLDGVHTQNWRQPQPPVLIAVNIDAADADKNYRADSVIAVDAAVGCGLLAADDAREPWCDPAAVSAAGRARLCAELPRETAFLDAVARAVPDDSVIVCDMCIPGYWLAGFHDVPGPRLLQVPLGWGTLGYAFPAALGAARVARRTLAVCGDGGFLFAAGELATVAQEQPDLTILVVDDGGYGMLATPLAGVPDFVALAAAFGIAGERVEDLSDDFAAALARQLSSPGPSLLHARAPALEPPPTTSPRWYRTVRA
jgi:thiamine pyrophosphate-dependent acetolactate synthase large subunit-like protein